MIIFDFRANTSPMLQQQQQLLQFLWTYIHGIPVPQPDHLPDAAAFRLNEQGRCGLIQLKLSPEGNLKSIVVAFTRR